MFGPRWKVFWVGSILGMIVFCFGETYAEKGNFEKVENERILQIFSSFFHSSSKITDEVAYYSLYNNLKKQCISSLTQKKVAILQQFIDRLSEEERGSFFEETKNTVLTQKLSCEKSYLYAKTLEMLQSKAPKVSFISEQDDEILQAEKKLQEKQIITIKNHNTHLQKTSFKLASIYAETVMQETLKNLYEKHYLTDFDLKNLSGNIDLFYYQQYGINEGKIYLKKEKKSDEIQLKSLSFKFNLYSMESFMGDLQEDIQRILIHELGHYAYYFSPAFVQPFKKICREEKKCTHDDFVAQYAEESLEEDFAESFAYQFFTLEYPNKFYPHLKKISRKVQEKLDLMNDLFAQRHQNAS